MTDSTDRILLVLFILIALLALVVYFSPRITTVRPMMRTHWYSTSAPASAGVVRSIFPVSSSRNSSSYSNTSSSYSSTSTPESTTTYYTY